MHGATRTPNTIEGKAFETNKVFEALMPSGYAMKFITDVQKRQRKTEMIPEPEELVREFFTSVDPPITSSGYAVLPCVKGLTEPLTRVLREYDLRVFNKPVSTAAGFPPPHKDRPIKADFHSVRNVARSIFSERFLLKCVKVTTANEICSA